MKKRYSSGIGIAATILLVGLAHFETKAQDTNTAAPAVAAPPDSVSAPAPVENTAPKTTVVDPPKENKSEAIVIKGKLQDEVTKETLIGATINVKGTNNAVVTDENGDFEITVKELPVTLVIGYIGYQGKEVEVYDPEIPVEVTLKPKLSVSEVVVVGYGEVERKNLISSITTIKAEDTKNVPVASFDAQLQGQAPGVQVNSFSGTPGEGVRLQVRGTASINASNDPLYVIDGVYVNNNSLATINLGSKKTSPLADINPADIESIEVLKDASAIAIYGSRGSNGVILVTTKRGEYEASKPKYNFNVSYGWQKADPKRMWKLTSGPEHAMLVNESWINSGIDNPKLNQTYENRPFRPASEVINGVAGRGTPEEQQTYDRLGRVFRTAHTQNYDFNVSGGSKTIRYYVGAGYTKQEGILNPASFDRGSFKFNFETKLNKRVTFGSLNGVYRTFRQQVRGGAGQEGGHLLAALHHPTYFPIYNPDGTYNKGSIYENIDILTNKDQINISTTSLRYVGNQFVDVAILPGLKFRSSFGLDYNNYREREYFSDITLNSTKLFPGGYRNEALTNYTIFQNEQTLSYKKALTPKHNIAAIIGNGIQSSEVKLDNESGWGFPNNSFKEISSASTRTANQSQSKSTIASFFGRANYNYNEKYFLEASLRADGSSKFGKNNRWGYFPAVGAAWRIKQEDFLKNVKIVSDLKLRVSAGLAGNQNGINDYAAQGLINGSGSYPDNATSGAKPGIAPQQLANPNLKWEKTKTYNAGIDLGLFKDRIYLNVDVYYKYTKDALLNVPVAASTGYSSILANAGEISNKGIEVGLSTVNIRTKDFEWSTNFNITRNVNRAEKLVNPITFEAREYRRTEEGQPLGYYWLYKQLYVDAQTGNAVIEDVNGDGKIDAADRQNLGNLIPKFYGGFSNTFKYKGFDFNALFTYQYGNSVFNFNKYILEGGGTRDASRSMLSSQLDRWQKPGDITNTPRLTSVGNNYNLEQNSRYLEDASFIRLKTVTFGYTLPQALTSKVKLEKVRVFAMGTNLLLFTKYTGADPESSGSAIPNQDGLDTATPPQPIGFQLGANISF